MRNDPMGDRMKRYEAATKLLLPRRTYTILRLDGRAFHTITKILDRPFDERFSRWMVKLTQDLCGEVSGSVFGYTQSDEISILMQDFASIGTEPWFGGEVQKIVSVAASYAADVFPMHGAHFDARVFTIPDPVEVANYFIWRQRDAARNAVLAYAQQAFGHRAIQNMDTGTLIHLLQQGQVPIETRYTHGVIVDKDHIEHEDGTLRSFWTSFVAPPLTCEPGFYLAKAIPDLPRLGYVPLEVAEGPAIPGRPVPPGDGFVVGSPEVDVAEDAEGEDGDA
jgi:tRNAHis guanylyltransferase